MLFVSHATTDDEAVNRINERLKAAGIETWIDHQVTKESGLHPGEEWDNKIRDKLNDCEAGLFMLTPTSAASAGCADECRRIRGLKKRLYIALLETVPLKDFPLGLERIQYVNLARDFDGEMTRLIDAIRSGVDIPAHDMPVGKRVTRSYDDRYSTYSIPMQGRAADLAKALADLQTAPLFITGVGGLGKSRLAAEIVTQGDHSGAVWQRLSATSSPEDVYRLLREHYALDATTPPAAVIQQVRADGKLLVVLDNAEALPDAMRPVFEHLADELASAGAALLVTTRVLDWSIPRRKRALEPSQLDLKDAARVVHEMAADLGLEIDTAPFADALAQAARLHPRLIELAVGKLSYQTAADILRELRDLQSPDADAALSEMIRQTVTQMETHDSAAPGVLRRLAVCRGGFTVEAAQAISAIDDRDTLNARLKTLIDYRFVRFDGARYNIDDLVRLAVGEDEDARRAHFDYYQAHAETVGGDQTQHDRYQKLAVESENLDAAFAWALVVDPAQAFWFAEVCREFLANRGRFADLLAWFTALEKALVNLSDERTRAAFYNSLGIVYWQHPFGLEADNLRRAVAAYQEALRFFTLEAASLDYAMTQNNLGLAYERLATVEDRVQNLRRAVTAYHEALRFWTPEAIPLSYARTQSNLGVAFWRLAALEDQAANLRRAVTAFHEALRFRTPEADPLAYAMTQNNLGNAYLHLAGIEESAPNLHRAIGSYREALRFYASEVAPLDYAQTQNNLGNAYANLALVEERIDDLQQAIPFYQEALRFRTPETTPLDYAMTQANLGIVFAESGDLDTGVACWREAERYFRVVGHTEDASKVRRWIEGGSTRLGGESEEDEESP